MEQLPEQERAAMRSLAAQYKQAIASINQRYAQARAAITRQTHQQVEGICSELDRHLEVQYLLFTPVRKQYTEHAALLGIEQRRERQNKARDDAYKRELESMRTGAESEQ